MATSKAQTVAGTTIGVSATLPATEDVTGYSALTYSLVGEVTDIGTFGTEYTLVTHNPVGDRNTYKFKSSRNAGALDLKLAKITQLNVDAGQAVLNAALASDNDYTFCVTYQDSSKAYFKGKVMSFTTAVSTVNNILMAECKVELTSSILESTGIVTYSRYMAQKMRGDSQYSTGASGVNTSFYKVEFDNSFDSAQWFVSSKVTSGTTGTYKVQFAVTDEIRVDTATRAILPMRAGVTYNDTSSNGWQNATFSGAATGTIALAPNLGNNNNAISMATDSLPLASITRADGKPGGILLIKVVQTNASGQYTQDSSRNTTWDGARTAVAGGPTTWFREWFPVNNGGVDAISNLALYPTNVAETNTGFTMMGYPVVHTTTTKPTDLILFTGDSRKEAAYSAYDWNNPTRQSAMSLSGSSRALSAVNMAGSGHSQFQYLEVAMDALTNGLKPTIIQLPAFSQNGFSDFATFKANNDSFMASARALPGLANVKFIIDTDYYVGGYTGNAETQRQLCIAYGKSLANGSTVFVFDSDIIMTDYTNPAAPVLRSAYMNADGVHANQVGQDAMTYGDGTHPGLQSLYTTVLAA